MTDLWTEDNAAQYVIAVMRVLLRYVLKDDRHALVGIAHGEANGLTSPSQAQYDLGFAHALRKTLGLAGVPASELTDNALLESQAVQQSQTPLSVVTDKAPPAAAPPRDPNDRSGWSVEDWQNAGISFRPAAMRIAPELQRVLRRPTADDLEAHRRTTPPDYTKGTDEAPWGVRATLMAKWAWAGAFNGAKLSTSKADELAHVLSYLYYAGVLKEGSVLPVGSGRKRDVRSKKQKGFGT